MCVQPIFRLFLLVAGEVWPRESCLPSVSRGLRVVQCPRVQRRQSDTKNPKFCVAACCMYVLDSWYTRVWVNFSHLSAHRIWGFRRSIESYWRHNFHLEVAQTYGKPGGIAGHRRLANQTLIDLGEQWPDSWLFAVWDCSTQLYRDYTKPLWGSCHELWTNHCFLFLFWNV